MKDDYLDEIIPRLEKNEIYIQLKKKCIEKDSKVIELVNAAVLYAYQRTKTIIAHMGEYTLHDGDHLFRVLYLMENLLTKSIILELSSPELLLLILSAFFHDIGMAPNSEEVIVWKKYWDNEPTLDENEKETYDKFKKFCEARPRQIKDIINLVNKGQITESDKLKGYLISEYVRITHADRAREIIEKDWNNKILFRDVDLTVEFAQICFSHNEEALRILDFDKNLICSSDTMANLQLVAVILRLADILDFDGKRTPRILFSHLNITNPVSLAEWNKHRAVESWIISPDLIQFRVKCGHPAIEATVHEFCDLIDMELSVSNNIISEINLYNERSNREIFIKIPYKVNRDKIEAKRNIRNKPLYIYRDTKFNLSKNQVIDLLMGTKLYGNPEVALRELLQNSIDACLLRKAQEAQWGNPYEPSISVKYYQEQDDHFLEVVDNGTGMDQYIIDKYYSNIGSSFYTSSDFFTLKAESHAKFSPTSRFGIGILSCFMISDTLIVDTKRVYAPHKSSEPLNITVEGQDSIFWIKEGHREMPGTSTKLLLREDENPWKKMNNSKFIKSLNRVIPNPPFPIKIFTSTEESIRDENSFRDLSCDSLKNYSWKENENIKVIDLELSNIDSGIVGSASVAILEHQNKPIDKIELNSRVVEIEGENFTLEREIKFSENSIQERSMTITIDDEGDIREDDSTHSYTNSKSRISLHGIEIPMSLFDDNFWEDTSNRAEISWPFPLLLIIDICGERDLDLNSSRTEILLTSKWIEFEEELAFLICTGIAKTVSKEYWYELKDLFATISENEVFIRGMNRVSI